MHESEPWFIDVANWNFLWEQSRARRTGTRAKANDEDENENENEAGDDDDDDDDYVTPKTTETKT